MTFVATILVNVLTLMEPEKRSEVLNEAPMKGMTGQDAVNKIQHLAKRMSEYSAIIRETTKVLRESGVIPELADSILEITSVVRDIAHDILQTAAVLKQ